MNSLFNNMFRNIPLFRGKERIAKFIYKKDILNERDIWISGKYGCEYLVPNIIENLGFDIFINGIYEQDTSDFIIDRLPKDGIFLDLGANIGAITIPVVKKRKDVRAICVEAAPWVYNYLQKNLERNGLNSVETINKALFYTDNEMLNFYSPDDKYGKGSLSPVFTNKEIQVTTIKVDSIIKEFDLQKVDIIKIDVEGYEYHVFKGAYELLNSEGSPDIIFEFVDWAEEAANGVGVGAAQQILKDFGYRIFRFENRKQMQEVNQVMTKGFSMFFATKRFIN